MKLGLFDTSELLIDTINKRLIHKESGRYVPFEKTNNENEALKSFNVALNDLEVKVGLWLIDQL